MTHSAQKIWGSFWEEVTFERGVERREGRMFQASGTAWKACRTDGTWPWSLWPESVRGWFQQLRT